MHSIKKYLLLLALLPTTAFAQLIGHWDFSGNANDISGNNLNGTVTNATLTAGQAGAPNTAYYFNGVDAHIDIPYNPLLNLTSWTISAIVKPMGFYSGVCQDNAIVWRGKQTQGNSYVLVVYDNCYDNSCAIHSPANEYFAGSAAGTTPVPQANWVVGSPVQLNTWYCFTESYGNDTLKFYIDGLLTVAMYWPNQYNYTPADNIYGLGFGYQQLSPGYDFWFNGVMDEIKLYNGALTDAQIYTYCNTFVNPDMTYSISPTINCNTVTWSATHVSGLTATQFSWDFGDATTGNGNPVTHTYTAAGTYTVKLIASDGAGNADTVTQNVTVSDPLNYDIISSVTCNVLQASANNLGTSAATQFSWDFGDATTGNGTPVTHAYAAAGTYNVRLIASNASGCADTITKSVTVATGMEYSIAVTNIDCKTAAFTANYVSGNTATQFTWLFGDATTGSGSSITHAYPSNGTYDATLIATNTGGCTDTVKTQVFLPFAMDYLIHDSAIDCKSAKLTAIYNTGDTAAQYQWLFANGTALGNPVTHTFTQQGQQSVSLLLTNARGCKDTIPYNFNISYSLFAGFTFLPLTPDKNKPTSFFNTSASTATNFAWDFGDNTSSSEENPVKTYSNSGNYKVCLTVQDANECSASICKTVSAIVSETIDIPNAFTPNGDGVNDILFVRAYNIKTLTFRVFNRWGQVIFESKSVSDGWDGTFRGQPAANDAYAYTIDATFMSGKTQKESGNINLIR